jgi:hypothetical protein
VSGSVRHGVGSSYDGDYTALELTGAVRVGSRLTGNARWTRQAVSLAGGDFATNRVPLKASYSFTTW